MASDAEVIKEFLVSVGVKLDESTLGKFEDIIGSIGVKVGVFALSLGGAALATEKFVDKITSNLEDLYWASIRLHSGVAAIQDYGLAIRNLGGTAEGARGSLENIARLLRTNPGTGGLLANLGVNPNSGAVNIAKNLVTSLKQRGMPYWVAVRYAETVGIDESTFWAEWNAKPGDLNRSPYDAAYKKAGINPDNSAKNAHDFQVQLRDVGVQFEVLAVNLASKLLPAIRELNGFLIKISGGVESGLNKVTAPLKWTRPKSWNEAWSNTKQHLGNSIGKGMDWLTATGLQQNFQALGWTKEQAAGIAANLMAESGGNARAVGDSGKGYGIAQWHPDRQAAFRRWAGHDIQKSSLDEQIKFIQYELTQGGEQKSGKLLRGAKSAAEAASILSQFYERPRNAAASAAMRGALAGQIIINQKVTVNVPAGATAGQTAGAIAGQQKRVNGDLVRNLKGALQ